MSNEGNAEIAANIKNEGEGTLSITNTGKVGDNTRIENNGNGTTQVEKWLVSTNSQGEVKALEIGGSNLSKVKVNNITFDAGNIANLQEVASNSTNFVKIDTTQDDSASSSSEVNYTIFKDITFEVNDPSLEVKVEDGSLTFNADATKTTAAILGKTLISNIRARASFANSTMNNAMNTVHALHNKQRFNQSNTYSQYESNTLYASNDSLQTDILTRSSYGADKNNLFFVLPYFSYSKVDLQAGLQTKGHTSGSIFGYSYFNPNNHDIYGVYVGYDDFDVKSPGLSVGGLSRVNPISLSSKTYYGGLRYYHTLTHWEDHEVFLKGSSQLAVIKNGITEVLATNPNGNLRANPKSYAYSLGANVGMHFELDSKNTLTPEIGLGYEGGFTRAFDLTNGNVHRKNYVHKTNFYKVSANLSWFRDWHQYFKTVINAGVEYTLNPKVDNPRGHINGIYYGGGKTKLDDVAGYLGVNFAIPLNDAFYFTLNYSNNFTQDSLLHTGYAKFNYLF